MSPATRKRLYLLLGCVVSAAAIWWSTRGVSFSRVGRDFARYQYLWLIPGLIAFYVSMYLRCIRWALLFRPHHALTGAGLFSPLMIGFAFNSILPARVGEFVRVYLVGTRLGPGIPAAAATVVVERIFDGLMLLILLVLCLALLPPLDPGIAIPWGHYTLDAGMINGGIRTLILGSSVLLAAVVLFLLPPFQRLMIGAVRRVPGLPERVRGAVERIILRFAQGFHSMKNPWVLLQVVAHSFAIWVLVGVSNMAVAYGFGLEMNLLEATAIVALIAIAILIPAAPGYWGLYEAGGTFSLLVLGVTRSESTAFAYTLMTHLLQYVPIVVVGLLLALRWHVRPVEAAQP
ncbi:MAG TPA: lysylphosphatidylglycerol synthase transmembrane domain-containing protein [Candidatus Sumerlaeota bacterium]|nr:lysylphosphatidylglycerol synthase transmembrane domain-containing protein [Candidatus Sumerlaeota bacterium]HOR27357.1 lysylphosphatidylglycerol synthase transmembrane domain-containing protein [Candidatus Sumerlaeota bacterium]HPK03174.1 lysylphosphatidylglycerol synthase transmembrane domain-containing protein [Candidatus Sumerlaeota bacterium]